MTDKINGEHVDSSSSTAQHKKSTSESFEARDPKLNDDPSSLSDALLSKPVTPNAALADEKDLSGAKEPSENVAFSASCKASGSPCAKSSHSPKNIPTETNVNTQHGTDACTKTENSTAASAKSSCAQPTKPVPHEEGCLAPFAVYDSMFIKAYFGFLKGNAVPPELSRQTELLLLKKREKTFFASLLRDFRLAQSESLYAQEKSAALREYEMEKNTLKDRMISELQEKKKRIAEEKDFLESAEVSSGFGTGRINSLAAGSGLEPFEGGSSSLLHASKGSGAAAGHGGAATSRKSRRRAELEMKAKRKSATDAVIRGQIPEMEVLEDLYLIFGDTYNAAPHKRKAKTSGGGGTFLAHSASDSSHPYMAYFRDQDNCLIYDSISYRKGDDVLVEKEDQEDYSGEILSVSTNELWIKTAEGIRSKINISQLRQGKTFLSHLGSQ